MKTKFHGLGSAGLVILLFGIAHAAPEIHDPRALDADPETATEQIAPVLEGLGDYHFPVTTDDPGSQRFFDQGLRLTYGFNHSEALRAFKEAARLDADNAMTYWGWALVLGPNLNLPMVPAVMPRAYEAIDAAMDLRDEVTERERAYIEALAKRYSPDPGADRGALDTAYADAMRALHQRYPDDLDAATLYAAALMNLSPWNYWRRDGSPRGNTETLIGVLESVLGRDPNHPGAVHYYIHAVEAAHPRKAVASADRLTKLMPGAGHMVHMPSHIYMRVGRYADSYRSNYLATMADEGYISQCRAQGLYPLNYYPHNIHFMVWSAMFQGRSEAAMEAARKIADKIPPTLEGNTWALYETFLSQPIYTMARFGQWEAALAEPKPAAKARFMTGIWHYARGLAFIHGGEPRKAQQERKALEAIRDGIVGDEYYIGFAAAPTLLTIASEVVAAELAARGGDYPVAINHLERAVRLQDGLSYNEPPDWYFPVRHILGAVLIQAGRADEAEVVYWTDLRRNPENGYALFGLKQSLEAQGKAEAAKDAEARFQRAWSQADVELTTSRF